MEAPALKQSYLDALERVGVQHLHRNLLAFVSEFFTLGALRGQQAQLAYGKVSFFEALDHLVAHGASCPTHRDFIKLAHGLLSLFCLSAPRLFSSAGGAGRGVQGATVLI